MLDVVNGKYKILGPLGTGGMGTIYKARDLKLGRLVALKFLHTHLTGDTEQKERLMREARAASSLDHPNICTIYEAGSTPEGHLFIAMAFYEGETVRQMVEKGPLPITRAVDIALQTVCGLEKAHEQGIIHRDINPANLILTREGVLKLVDFGLAKLSGSAQITQPQAMLGTPAYMAPEQITGEEADHRADLWALGAVMYEMSTGHPPFPGGTFREVALAILQREPDFPSLRSNDTRSRYMAIACKGLQKDLRRRYQSAGSIIVDLQMLQRRVEQEEPPQPVHEQRTAILMPGEARTLRESVRESGSRLLSGNTGADWRRWAAPVLALLLVLAAAPFLFHEGWRQNVEARICQWFPSSIAFCALPATHHLAVLNFETKGGISPDWSLGLAEEVHNRLRSLMPHDPALCVHRPVAQPEQPGFGLVVGGSMEEIGGNVVTKVELRAPREGRVLRSFTLRAPRENYWRLQDTLGAELAAMLDIPFNLPSQSSLGAGRTEIPEAYDTFLKASGILRRNLLDRQRRTPEETRERIEKAVSGLTAALTEDAYFGRAHVLLADALRQLALLDPRPELIEQAKEHCRQAIEQNLDFAPAYAVLGQIYWNAGEYIPATEHFQKALSLAPGDLDVAEALSDVFAARCDLTAARAVLEQAATQRRCWQGYARLGDFCLRHQMLPDAEQAFLRSIEQDRENARAYTNLGVLHKTREEYAAAEKALLKSIHLQPTSVAYSNLGTIYYYLDRPKRFRQSAEAMEKARDLAPGDYRYWANLAEMYALIPEKRDAARGVFQRAIELAEQARTRDPGNAALLTRLANSYAYLGDHERAAATIAQAARLAPGDVYVQFGAAKVFALANDIGASLKHLEQAIRGGYSLEEIRLSEPLAPVRADPRYAEIEKVGKILKKTDCTIP